MSNFEKENSLEYLYVKLHEDIFRLFYNKGLDELTDVLELIFSIGEKYGYSYEDLLREKEKRISKE